MIITLTRTGGFTGIPLRKVIDTTSLQEKQAEQIQELLVQSNLLKRFNETKSSNETKETQAPDRFTYSLSMQNNAVEQNVTFEESSLDSQLKDLITYLQNL